MRVSYEKEIRDKAKAEQKGLMTLEIIDPSKKAGKFGGRMTMQGPIDEAECRHLHRMFLRLIKTWKAKP